MEKEEKNNQNDNFGKNILLRSIFYEDPKVAKELKNFFKKKENISDKPLKDSFNNSASCTDKQYELNLSRDKYNKFKSNKITEEDNLYLKIDDFPDTIDDDYLIYYEAYEKIENYISYYKDDLSKMDIYHMGHEKIDKGKSIEAMVEETYHFNKDLKKQITQEICILKRVINCCRHVEGDGNCFYRSVIFSWLEYLIFNQKIVILRIIIANIYTKFDYGYSKNKELLENITNQFITEEKNVAMTILLIIIQFLENNNISEAYLTLLKSFNGSKAFDRIMIFYLRYILYEFISNNKDKLFSEDFPQLLGILLPKEYQTEDGLFLYKDYFENDLLKLHTFAETISIYLVPFLLKINLNIIYYDYGKDCIIRNKILSSNLKNKDTISILYKKIHYDICYTNDYYNRFENYLNLYCNLELEQGENYKVIDPNDIIQTKNDLDKIIPFNVENSILFNNILIVYDKNTLENNVQKEKEIQDKNEDDEDKDVEKHIEISEIMILCGIIKNRLIINKCFICDKILNNYENINEILPCKCIISFCTEECKKKYYNCLALFFNSMDFKINIKCGTCGNFVSRITILENLNLFIGNINVKNALKTRMLDFFKTYCKNCLLDIKTREQYHIYKYKCEELKKLLDTNKFEHNLCKECENNKKKTGFCNLCNIYHYTLV